MLEELYSEWFEEDPLEARDWLRTVVPSEAADPAVRMMVRTLNERKRPKLALDWAHLLNEDILRLTVLKSVSRAWYREDPEAFEEWLPNSGLEIELGQYLSYIRSSTSNDGESPPL
jgi:hypothetical protein